MVEVLYDSPYEVHDPRFAKLINPGAKLERLATGFRWAEGPAYFPAQRRLIWSDIPNNRMMSWNEVDGSVAEFRNPSDNCNGHTIDRQGRLVSCSHLRRAVIRTEHDGSTTVIADSYQGGRLNSPNDVVVHSDGSVWFTDPSYGIDTDYEGARGARAERLPRLPRRPRHGRGLPRRGRLRAPERARVLDRREEALHRRLRPDPRRGPAAPHPGLRRRRGQDAQGRRGLRGLRARLLRRLPPRRAGQHLDLGRRRRAVLRPRRHPHRQDQAA
jgi:hypothetical protein